MKSTITWLSWAVLVFILGGCVSNKTLPEAYEGNPDVGLVALGNGICQDTSSGLMWATKKSDIFPAWEDARAYADGLEYGGYADWRLPSKDELYRLHDIFFWKKNGECRMQTSGSYWWGSEEKNAVPGFWETYYLCSPEYKFVDTPGKGVVRAVRP